MHRERASSTAEAHVLHMRWSVVVSQGRSGARGIEVEQCGFDKAGNPQLVVSALFKGTALWEIEVGDTVLGIDGSSCSTIDGARRTTSFERSATSNRETSEHAEIIK